MSEIAHPISLPDKKLQYRAVGLLRGKYLPGSENSHSGTILTIDGCTVKATLQCKNKGIIKRKTNPSENYLWVVYPRCNRDPLRVQVAGVWKPCEPIDSELEEEFSVRGEVVYQSFNDKKIFVKIRQSPRNKGENPRFFKLKLNGVLPLRAVGKFWEFKVKRKILDLEIITGELISKLPKKVKSKSKLKKPSKPVKKVETTTPNPVKKIEATHPKPVLKKLSFTVK